MPSIEKQSISGINHNLLTVHPMAVGVVDHHDFHKI